MASASSPLLTSAVIITFCMKCPIIELRLVSAAQGTRPIDSRRQDAALLIPMNKFYTLQQPLLKGMPQKARSRW